MPKHCIQFGHTDALRISTRIGPTLPIVGDARHQTQAIARRVDDVVRARPEAAAYTPEPVL